MVVYGPEESDLGMMEAAFDKLETDTIDNELAEAGRGHIQGSLDDELIQTVGGDPGEDAATVQYVGGVRAAAAAGSIVGAQTAGLEIADKATNIGGATTVFVRYPTGPDGQIGWLTYLDSTQGCFVEDTSITATTLNRTLS